MARGERQGTRASRRAGGNRRRARCSGQWRQRYMTYGLPAIRRVNVLRGCVQLVLETVKRARSLVMRLVRDAWQIARGRVRARRRRVRARARAGVSSGVIGIRVGTIPRRRGRAADGFRARREVRRRFLRPGERLKRSTRCDHRGRANSRGHLERTFLIKSAPEIRKNLSYDFFSEFVFHNRNCSLTLIVFA